MAFMIACPNCGSTEMAFIEDAILYREVKGFDGEGNLHIEGSWKTSDGDNSRFRCDDCMYEWPLSEFLAERLIFD